MWTAHFSKLVVAALCAMSVSPAMAQSRSSSGSKRSGYQVGASGSQQNQQAMQREIQQIGQLLQEGEKALKTASEKAAESRREWQKVDTEHKQHLRELTQAKKFAEEEAKNAPGLTTAKAQLEGLRSQLADVRKKVIGTLKQENEDYQKAIKVHDEAVAEQKANSGPSVSPKTRQELAKKAAETDQNRRTIEDVVMADNSEAKELANQITDATAELAAASKKKNEAIETNPKLNSAKVAFQRTRDELKKAKADLDQADGEANRIRNAMQSLANQRASIQSELQMSSGSPSNRGGTQSGNQSSRKR